LIHAFWLEKNREDMLDVGLVVQGIDDTGVVLVDAVVEPDIYCVMTLEVGY